MAPFGYPTFKPCRSHSPMCNTCVIWPWPLWVAITPVFDFLVPQPAPSGQVGAGTHVGPCGPWFLRCALIPTKTSGSSSDAGDTKNEFSAQTQCGTLRTHPPGACRTIPHLPAAVYHGHTIKLDFGTPPFVDRYGPWPPW